MRKLILFGNGLGRALDNDFFSLEAALSTAWTDSNLLTEIQRTLILQCLPEVVLEASGPPRTEADLDRLQRVLAACEEIKKHEIGDTEQWLSPHGREFPLAIRAYIHGTASYFHKSTHTLPLDFTSTLREYILESRSHVATLNYDRLLYSAFTGTEVFQGYDCLIDGFVPYFSPENLNRNRPLRQSFYLHLHGSPLYFNSPDGTIRKSELANLPRLHGYSTNHVVLTHVEHKMSVINASPVLREYWRRLEEAMQETDGIILFGYSGADAHLNNLIGRYYSGKQVEVVERKHPSYDTEEGKRTRFQYWKSKLSTDTLAHWKDNVLEFGYWDYVQ